MQGEEHKSKCEDCIYQRHTQQKSDQKSNKNKISLQNNKTYLRCSQCQIIKCCQCFKTHIIQIHPITHKQNKIHSQQKSLILCEIVCQECQEKDSKNFCQNCQQHLCQNCSFRIHNKGKRAKHQIFDNIHLKRFQNLFIINQNDDQQIFRLPYQLDNQKQKEQVQPYISVVVFSGEKPNFIQQFESLHIEDTIKITIQELQSCINRYPLIKNFSISEENQILIKQIKFIINNQSVKKLQQKKQSFIQANGCKIKINVRKPCQSQQNNQNSNTNININNSGQKNQQFIKDKVQLITNPQVLNFSSSNQRLIKKQSVEYENEKNEDQMINNLENIECNLKNELKLSNRSLIIQIPETKKYQQSPIKSDRQQGFIERYQNKKNYNFTHNDKTLTININSNYNDISETSTANILQNQSQYKSSNDQSILMKGSLQNQKDTSFKIISNQNSYSYNANQLDDSGNCQDINNTHIVISFSQLNPNNSSLLTDNSIKKKKTKIPLPYFQPLKSKNIQNSNNYSYDYYMEQKYRNKMETKLKNLAQKGILMINNQKFIQMNFKFDDIIMKKIKKNICDKQYYYFSLNLQTISIQSLCWIIESIKLDKMMPCQKLILSRLKESFNIKPSNKLWLCIIKYLESYQYSIDKQDFDQIRILQKIHIRRLNDQLLFQYQNKWTYDDQYEAGSSSNFSFNNQQWQIFKTQLKQYFKIHKQITGGRYGCVQYIKINGPQKLRNCSLGKLSYYVQQAINKGFIRYHKTLLIQNQSFQKQTNKDQNNFKLFGIQKQLKIFIVQSSLIDIFLESGEQNLISLAQIPLQLKKRILFDINLLELGFPKLKNILQTLSDKLELSSSKSHIKYQSIRNQHKISQFKLYLQQMLKDFISQICQIIVNIVKKAQNIMIEQLYNFCNQKLGFTFDYRVCNVGDFCQFLLYYCQQKISLQFINGVFIAFSNNLNYLNYQNYLYSNYMNYNQINQYKNQKVFEPQNCSNYFIHNKNNPMNYEQNLYKNIPLNQTKKCGHSNYNKKYQQEINSNNIDDYNKNYQYQEKNIYVGSYQQNNKNSISSYQEIQYEKNFNQNKNKNKNIKKYKNKDMLINIPEISQNSTPKFNQSLQYINQNQNHNIKTLNNFKWQTYMNILPNFQQTQDPLMSNIQNKYYNNNQQNQSFTDFQSIYNILDDDNSEAKSKISHPKTFIEKQGSFNNINEQGQLYISKITPIDEKSDPDQEYDGSFGFFDESPKRKDNNKVNLLTINHNQNDKINKKGQHNRVYSTTQQRTKHQRMYSTTTSKN